MTIKTAGSENISARSQQGSDLGRRHRCCFSIEETGRKRSDLAAGGAEKPEMKDMQRK